MLIKSHSLTRLWFTCVLLLGLLGACLYFWVQTEQKHRDLLVASENQYQRAFFHLNDTLLRIQQTFGNLSLIHEPNAQRRYWLYVWRYSQSAQNDIAQLPLIWRPLTETQTMLDQLQKEAMKKVVHPPNSKPIQSLAVEKETSEKEIRKWYERTRTLATRVQNLQNQWIQKQWKWNDLSNVVALQASSKSTSASQDEMLEAMDGLESKLNESSLNPLMNDKPNTNQILQNKSSFTLDEETKKHIQRSVKHLLPKYATKINLQNLNEFRSSEFKEIPTYQTQMDGFYLEIEQKAPHRLVAMMTTHKPGPAQLTEQKLNGIAINRIESWIGGNWVIEHSQIHDGYLTIRAVPVQNQVHLSTDVIIIQIARDTGDILGIDLSAFLSKHQQREFVKPRWTDEQLIRKLDPSVRWRVAYPVLRTDEWKQEVYCTRLIGTFDGQQIYVDLNRQTGEVEMIERWVHVAQESTPK